LLQGNTLLPTLDFREGKKLKIIDNEKRYLETRPKVSPDNKASIPSQSKQELHKNKINK
jgi:hypothetical protein